METKKAKGKTFYFLLAFLSFYFLFLNLDKQAAAGLSLGISPPFVQITAQAPNQIKTPIVIQNYSDESIELDILFKPFSASQNKNENPETFDTTQIFDNNNPIQDLTLSPKQQKKLFLKIDIPENAPDSDYYFSIQFISKPTRINNNLNYSQVLAGVGTNVLLSIGKQNAKAILQEFLSPLFLEKAPVQFTLKIKNTGNHFITPKGIIIIKNMFGQIVGKVNIADINILKDSTRSINPAWNKSFLLGAYTADLTLSLSPDGPIFTRSISFFAVPYQSIIMMLISAMIILLIYNRIKKRLTSKV